MKIDINKDFETAYQQSIWKGLDLKQLITVAAFADGDRDYGCPLVFFKRSAAGRSYIGILAALPDPVFGTVQIPGNVYPYVMQRMEVSAETKKLCGKQKLQPVRNTEYLPCIHRERSDKRNGNF